MSRLTDLTAALGGANEAILAAEKKAREAEQKAYAVRANGAEAVSISLAAPDLGAPGEPDILAEEFIMPDFREFPLPQSRREKSSKNRDPKPPKFENLIELLDGEIPQEMPEVAKVSETRSLFYRGAINEIHGEPGVGKSNLGTAGVIAVAIAGGSSLIIDPEDTRKGFMQKLRSLCSDDPRVLDAVRSKRIEYFRLHDPADIFDLQAWAIENRPDLVWMDGLADALSAEGLNEDVAGEVLDFFRRQIRPFAEEAGAAVLISDHVAKAESPGGWARGSGAKLGRYDGVSYLAKVGQAYTPTVPGFVKLFVAKDRKGGVGPKGAHICNLHFAPGENGTELTWEDVAPVSVETGKAEFRPTSVMEKIVALIKTHSRVSASQMVEEIDSRKQTILKARTILLEEGTISKQREGLREYYSLTKKLNPADYKK